MATCLFEPWSRPGSIRRLRWRLAAACALMLVGCREAPPPPLGVAGLPAIVIGENDLEAPTAVIHDPRADVYLVTNAPAAYGRVDEPGFVTRIAPDGRVVSRRWIDGRGRLVELRHPTAMAIRGDTLFVADQTCVRIFHRTSGQPLGSACPDGTAGFAGLAVKDHVLYVADQSATPESGVSITTLNSRGSLTPVPGSEAVGRPSGIAAGPWGLFVTATGEDYVSQLTPTGPRTVLRGSAKQVGGIVAARDGSFAFSNRTDSAVLYVDVRYTKGRGALYTLARQLAEPGQLGYDAHRDRILIPEAGRNRVTIIELMKSEGSWVPEYKIR